MPFHYGKSYNKIQGIRCIRSLSTREAIIGVSIHILEHRTVWLEIAGMKQEIGTLRHLSKVTELDDRRKIQLEEAKPVLSPNAVLVSHPTELPSALNSGGSITAHQVIGWDEGRGSVTDLDWDYLPILGYAVRDPARGMFVLHELRDGLLFWIDSQRADELALLADGILVRRGQPVISECREVKSFIPGYAEAECLLEDGRRDRIIMRIDGDMLPEPSWLVGRKPRDVERFGPTQAVIGGLP